MKVKWGMFITDGSGKVGGHVAAKNAAGSYIRTKVTPSNPRTAAQLRARENMAANAKLFSTLTSAQVATWNDFAKNAQAKNVFGEKMKLSGINVFARLNNNLRLIGKDPITEPPAATAVSAIEITAVSLAKGTPAASITLGSALPAGATLVVRATDGVNQSKNFVKSEYRIIGQFTTAPAGALDVLDAYVSKFGAVPVEGKKVFFEAFVINDTTGAASQRSKNNGIVAA